MAVGALAFALSTHRWNCLPRSQRGLLMIWNAVSKFGNHHPVVMRGVVGTIAFTLFGYVVLAALTSEIIDGNRDSCERGNAARLADFREATSLETAVVNERAQEPDPMKREAMEERIEVYKTKQEALILISESTGNQTTPNAVTINCTDEWPKPLPWLSD